MKLTASIIAIILATVAVPARSTQPAITNLLAHFEAQGMPLQGVTSLALSKSDHDAGLVEAVAINYQDEQTLKVYYTGTFWRVENEKALASRKKHAELFKYPIYVNGFITLTIDEADPKERERLIRIFQYFNNSKKKENGVRVTS